jgi:hypothetical protein
MLKDILAISGQPGLFKLISKGKNSIIVESLVNGKRMPAHSANKITSMEDIAIFTVNGEVPLKDILKKMEEMEAKQPVVSPKANPDALKAFFKLVLPDYDEARVYTSDIKKVVGWYLILKEKELLIFEESSEEESSEKE